MRKIYILLLLLAVSITGCMPRQQKPVESKNSSTQQDSSVEAGKGLEQITPPPQVANISVNDKDIKAGSKIIINEQSSGEKGIFYLDMTYQDVTKLDLYNTDLQITQTSKVDGDKNDWNFGNRVVWTPKTCFVFDKTDTLYNITVNGNIPTGLGLKTGDSLDILEKLYGKGDKQYNFAWGKVFEYKIADRFFNVTIQENKVLLWGVSKYPYDYSGK